ncbi:MAG: helix-turn-helix domain-containing protein [candidate division Zixibacteria bacterium]|nr:helix-turn-helix domain-containing protein [candidate division Zixibacteria bacterium]
MFPSPWLTTREAAAYCKLSESYLNALRSKRRGPPFQKVGRLIIYHRDSLDGWLRRSEK